MSDALKPQPEPDREEWCGHCRFFEPHWFGQMGDRGRCRRRAPKPSREKDGDEDYSELVANWPLVCTEDWCGEFERNAEAWIEWAGRERERREALNV